MGCVDKVHSDLDCPFGSSGLALIYRSLVSAINMEGISEAENEARMLRGELYHAFRPKLTAKRNRCHSACNRLNNAGDAHRRRLVELWRE